MLWSAVGGFALGDRRLRGGGSGQAEVKMMDTDRRRQHFRRRARAGAKKMFEMMDADGDGIVTAKEMEAAHKDMPTAQRGSSGESDTQMRAASRRTEHHDKSAAAKIKMIDTDGDGTITAAEHEAGAQKMFEKMDKDHDGKLSAAESRPVTTHDDGGQTSDE
jgi:Ca2+-binding EF-hand superfamily protein